MKRAELMVRQQAFKLAATVNCATAFSTGGANLLPG